MTVSIRLRAGVLAIAAAIFAGPSGLPRATAETVAISCSSVGIEFELCRDGAEAWAAKTGHRVRLVSTPNDASERLALYQQLLAAGAGDIDVFQVDVIWPGILGAHFVDLRPFVPEAERARHFPALIENDTVGDRLVALPWFVDAGLLYYRSDLLERYGEQAPRSWAELARIAARIQAAERGAGNPRMWGFVFQARAYEGLTCNALEWIVSHGGGTIVDASGAITVNNPRAAAALAQAAGWIGTIAPPGVLNYAEEEARGVFQSGDAVFMRNWPYAWALANAADSPVRGRVAIAPLPASSPDGRRAGTLGGQHLAVSRYSRVPALAADLVRHLAGRSEQKRRAIVAAFHPTIPDLYADAEIRGANPFLAGLQDVFTGAVARPARITGARYNQVSNAFTLAVHATLAGEGEAGSNLAALEARLRRLQRQGRW